MSCSPVDVSQSSGATNARLLAWAARIAILVLAGAMALRQMGIANEIVNLAFALLLALCVGLTVAAGPAMDYMQATARSLHAPQDYVRQVLSAPRAGAGGD